MATLMIGIVVGAILYSNTINQQITIIETENAMTITLVSGIAGTSFRDTARKSMFNVTKNVDGGLYTYTWNVLVDHIEPLGVPDLTIGFQAYDTYLGTIPYYEENPTILAKNFGTGNAHEYVMGLSAYDYSYIVLTFTFHNGCPAGNYDISVWIDDFIA